MLPSQEADRRAVQDALAGTGLSLVEGACGLQLSDGVMTVCGDFGAKRNRLAPGKLNRELLVRAAKVKADDRMPLAVDATAGLGDDALLLAAAGFRVIMFERNPVIAALLADALERASCEPDLVEIAARMMLVSCDSIGGLGDLRERPDIVLLDPMFPAKAKNAQVKKKLQLLQRLERPCDDEEALLDAALAVRPRKVVVKRPAKGPYLAGRKPDYSLAGKAIRFDCIVNATAEM